MTNKSNEFKWVFIAVHNVMVGFAITRQFKNDNPNLLIAASKDQPDLTNQQTVNYNVDIIKECLGLNSLLVALSSLGQLIWPQPSASVFISVMVAHDHT
ncbi:MAG: hypothetical protein ACI9YE_000036 [Psychroserpens sp.]|jgi:hypothetical protein